MSKLFCISPGLRVLERQMQQPPGYRPRGYGICIIEEMDWKSRGNYSEIVDCVISRMQLEHLKKRVEEIFSEADSEIIFRSMKHRKDFYQATINAIERIEEIFALPDEELDKCLEVPQPIKKISIRNLCFSHEGGKNILNNANLEFHSNNITAIMGLSGCGKTTLIKVLLGFYSFNEGKIKFNDVDMDTSGLICARKKIAYVEQETCFFKGTLIDNLIISGVDDKGKFIEIAKEFDLYDEIVQMPEMMNTQLTSGATNLSVGQRKRLYNYLQSIKKNKIIIVITHNNEEKDYFDKIIFLDKK